MHFLILPRFSDFFANFFQGDVFRTLADSSFSSMKYRVDLMSVKPNLCIFEHEHRCVSKFTTIQHMTTTRGLKVSNNFNL
jgi:hypothetical protein